MCSTADQTPDENPDDFLEISEPRANSWLGKSDISECFDWTQNEISAEWTVYLGNEVIKENLMLLDPTYRKLSDHYERLSKRCQELTSDNKT